MDSQSRIRVERERILLRKIEERDKEIRRLKKCLSTRRKGRLVLMPKRARDAFLRNRRQLKQVRLDLMHLIWEITIGRLVLALPEKDLKKINKMIKKNLESKKNA
ncbi:MAG: hypothetical protein ACW99G_21695 [Candidatus Thorarchaeota archaeon]|jgi:hypothetical protein